MTYPIIPTRDSTWIATQALTSLLKASVDNPPSPEDMALALDTLVTIADSLSKRGIIMIADLDAVPAGIASSLATRLAIDLKASFGLITPDGQDALGAAKEVEMDLRRMDAPAAQGFGPAKVSFW